MNQTKRDLEAERTSRASRSDPRLGSNRMPEGSTFYELVIPGLLILFGVVTAALILFAVGVLLGIIPFQ